MRGQTEWKSCLVAADVQIPELTLKEAIRYRHRVVVKTLRAETGDLSVSKRGTLRIGIERQGRCVRFGVGALKNGDSEWMWPGYDLRSRGQTEARASRQQLLRDRGPRTIWISDGLDGVALSDEDWGIGRHALESRVILVNRSKMGLWALERWPAVVGAVASATGPRHPVSLMGSDGDELLAMDFGEAVEIVRDEGERVEGAVITLAALIAEVGGGAAAADQWFGRYEELVKGHGRLNACLLHLDPDTLVSTLSRPARRRLAELARRFQERVARLVYAGSSGPNDAREDSRYDPDEIRRARCRVGEESEKGVRLALESYAWALEKGVRAAAVAAVSARDLDRRVREIARGGTFRARHESKQRMGRVARIQEQHNHELAPAEIEAYLVCGAERGHGADLGALRRVCKRLLHLPGEFVLWVYQQDALRPRFGELDRSVREPLDALKWVAARTNDRRTIDAFCRKTFPGPSGIARWRELCAWVWTRDRMSESFGSRHKTPGMYSTRISRRCDEMPDLGWRDTGWAMSLPKAAAMEHADDTDRDEGDPWIPDELRGAGR